jgi:hypothetical protein
MGYQADQFGIYLALAVHGGAPCDFVDEDAVLNDTVMAAYRVLFVTEPNIPAAVTERLGTWAKAGGSLVLSAGAATLNEYNDTDTTLSTLTGNTLSQLNRRVLPEVPEVAGPSPLPLAAHGFIERAGGMPHVPFLAYGDVNSFGPPNPASATLSTFAGPSKSPSGLETTVMNGRIVQLAWQPGLSYLVNATQEYTIPSPRDRFPTVVRDFLSAMIATTVPVTTTIETSAGTAVVGVETVLLASSVGAVVTVVNWGGVEVGAEVTLRVNLSAAGLTIGTVGKVFDAWSRQDLTPVFPSGAAYMTVCIRAYHANFIAIYRT